MRSLMPTVISPLLTLALSAILASTHNILDTIARQNMLTSQVVKSLQPATTTSYQQSVEVAIEEQPESPKVNQSVCSQSRKNLLELILQNHDKAVVPSNVTVNVDVEFTIQDIIEIHEMTSTFEVDLWFSQIWHDPTLRFDHLSCRGNLSLGATVRDRIWTPNGCFVNSKKTEIHESPGQNILLLLFANGTVWLNYRVRVHGPCKMDLHNFPIDTKVCQLIFESYSYNTDEVQLHWQSYDPVTFVDKNLTIPDFILYNHTWTLDRKSYTAGNWDQLVVNLYFKRLYKYYMLKGYLPSYVAVSVSWMTLWTDWRSLAGRMVINVSILVAITFHFGNLTKNLPALNYVNGIDLFILICIVFVATVLVESAVVGVILKLNNRRVVHMELQISHNMVGSRIKRKASKKRSLVFMSPNLAHEMRKESLAESRKACLLCGKSEEPAFQINLRAYQLANQIDFGFIKLYPFCFVVVNAVYWYHYLHTGG